MYINTSLFKHETESNQIAQMYTQYVQSHTVVIHIFLFVSYKLSQLILVGWVVGTRDMKHLCDIWTQCKNRNECDIREKKETNSTGNMKLKSDYTTIVYI